LTALGYRDTALRRARSHHESHAAIRSNPRSFVAGTEARYLWDEAASEPGTRLVGGRCRVCRSDLAIELPADHALVNELESA
jgi:hypothetical protein